MDDLRGLRAAHATFQQKAIRYMEVEGSYPSPGTHTRTAGAVAL